MQLLTKIAFPHNKKVSSSLYKVIIVAYQYIITYHQKGKQVVTILR